MNDTALRFLADESCDFGVVKALRFEGYDVLALDFGQLVFASQADSAGVILIRYPGNARKSLQEAVVNLVREQGKDIENAFVVMQPGHIRVSRKK
jgi:hypothetical protein